MRRERIQGRAKLPLTQGDDSIQALLLDGPDEPLRMRVAVRRTRRCPNHANARRVEQLLRSAAPLRIPIAQQDPSLAQQAVALTGHMPQALNDECLVRVRRRTDHSHPARVQLQNERGVVRHQSSRRPHLGREEVRRHQRRPMRLHKRSPRRRLLPAWWNSVGVQDPCDGRAADAVAHVLQCALNPCVPPGRILRRHPNHQRSEMCLQARRMAAAGTIGPFARHQLAVPSQDGIRRYDCRNLRQQTSSEAVSQLRQAPPLVILKPKALPRKPAFQESILCPQERDQIGLFAMKPATEGRKQQPEREHPRSLRHCRRSTRGTLRARTGASRR